MSTVFVSGSFDDLRLKDIRFLQEASRLGDLHVQLWSDEVVHSVTGQAPKFPLAERRYFVESVYYVHSVSTITEFQSTDVLAPDTLTPNLWAVRAAEASSAKEAYCRANNVGYKVIDEGALGPIPTVAEDAPKASTGRKKVIVTGCFDWFHTGHVRFFEEASEHGELYVVVGNDTNLHHLKGDGHPMFPEDERRYLVGSIRFVHQALISSGMGWMDAVAEIDRIKPDIYIVNEDGDKPEKIQFCKDYGLEYRVLKRLPKEGLPKRQSTDLRGF